MADACQEFSDMCPIKAGPQEVRGSTFQLPELSAFCEVVGGIKSLLILHCYDLFLINILMQGDWKGSLVVSDENGRLLGCITASLTMSD